MSSLSEHFTGLRDFVDVRQDTLIPVLVYMRDLDSVMESDNPTQEFLSILDRNTPFNVLQDYRDSSQEIRRAHYHVSTTLHNIQFSRFKSFLGDTDFV